MSVKENKALACRVFDEIWNEGSLDVADEIFDANYVSHGLGIAPGPASFKQYVSVYLSAFPDCHFTIEDQVAEGDKVVTRWTATGTHTGELIGIPPTDVQATVTGISINRYAGGKVVEVWDNWDGLGMMQQLGVIPPMGG